MVLEIEIKVVGIREQDFLTLVLVVPQKSEDLELV